LNFGGLVIVALGERAREQWTGRGKCQETTLWEEKGRQMPANMGVV
jgi:hypothetical protein